MGHVIDFKVVDTRDEIWVEALEFAEYNVDRQENPSGSYHGNLTYMMILFVKIFMLLRQRLMTWILGGIVTTLFSFMIIHILKTLNLLRSY